MGENKWEPLGKVKMAIMKIKFLLNFNTNRWQLASIMGKKSSGKRRLSFSDRPGLRACMLEEDVNRDVRGSSARTSLVQSTSFPPEDDVDERAEAFIANFYKQLKYERQISLELSYSRVHTPDY